VSWPLVKLGEVAQVNPRLPKNVDATQEVIFLPMSAISEQGQIIEQEKRILSETRKGFTYFEKNDVVVAKITPCFENGKAAFLDCLETQIGFGTTEFHVIRPNIETLDGKYLFYLVWNKWFRHLGERNMSGSAGQKRVPTDFLKELEIPLPPLEEQKRIAAILDKADAIRRKRQQAIQLADDFLRSVFLDMFGDPMVNPMGWALEPWGSVLRIINGKNQKAVLCPDGEYPIMGSGGEMGRANDYLSPENTVIIGRKGNINKPILVKEKYWNVDTAFGLVPNKELISHNYLYWFCKFFNFEKLNKTVTIPSLTKADLLDIKIPVPNLTLIKKFDDVVAQLELTKVLINNSLIESNQAFNSLSQKAFAGEL
jgi:type I restriction enzyme S subunit